MRRLVIVLALLASAASAHAAATLGSAVTPLDVADAGSRANVRDVARRLAPLVVPPHSALSLRAALTTRGGAARAPGGALLEGRRVEEPGGGACQIAGTVYLAALRAGLGVLERSGHSAAVRTLPSGVDAALSLDAGTDLVLWNGYDTPVRLDLTADAASLTARWSADAADGADLPAAPRLSRDADGALTRRCADGREEIVAPRPPRRPPPAGAQR